MSEADPTTEIVACTGRVGAPLPVVWDLVSDFGGVGRWSIGPVTCTVDGTGVGAIRTVHRGNRAVRERLERWDGAGHSLSYSFVDDVPLPVEHLVATISVRAVSQTESAETEITWSACGDVEARDRSTVRDALEGFFSRRIGELQTIAPARAAEHD